MLTTTIGIVASTISLFIWLPQFIKIVKNRNNPLFLQGISAGTQLMALTNSFLWLIYGNLNNDFWIAFPSYFSIPLTLGTLYFLSIRKAMPVVKTKAIIVKNKAISAKVTTTRKATNMAYLTKRQISDMQIRIVQNNINRRKTANPEPLAATIEMPLVTTIEMPAITD